MAKIEKTEEQDAYSKLKNSTFNGIDEHLQGSWMSSFNASQSHWRQERLENWRFEKTGSVVHGLHSLKNKDLIQENELLKTYITNLEQKLRENDESLYDLDELKLKLRN